MNDFKLRLTERIRRTPTVESFRFMPDKKIDFIPGQFLQVIFDPATLTNKDLNKYLSFSSSPTKDYIEFTKRLSKSLFSQKLRDLALGDEVLIRAPMGSCVFKEGDKKIGFLIGGIGITPVISILGYIIDKKLDTDVFLFYSNRTDSDIAFKKELDYWQSVNKNIKVFYTVTDCQPKDNSCLFGFIDRKLLEQKACDSRERVFYIFGPPKMVEELCSITFELECKKENIRTEKFLGY